MKDYRLSREFLGQGLAYPLKMDPRGGIALARGEQDIAQSIKIILSTAPGERVMRPEFGCRVHELAFAPRNPTTEGLLIYYVEQALGRWEPRIVVQEVTIRPDQNDRHAGTWFIDIKYRIKATHDDRSIVYPFYLLGEEE
ncbi:MAG: GPW/gp25 family protein [Anaerolineae bacterium]|nr:GPW/gp25 family protein [Anaerolineae bacterium]